MSGSVPVSSYQLYQRAACLNWQDNLCWLDKGQQAACDVRIQQEWIGRGVGLLRAAAFSRVFADTPKPQ